MSQCAPTFIRLNPSTAASTDCRCACCQRTHPVANTFNLPYQPYAADGWEYDNIFYTNGSPNFDQGGLGLRGSGADYNAYYVAPYGYFFSDDSVSLQNPPEVAMTVTSAEVSGIVGLADGTSSMMAFQNGNY